MKNLAYYTSIMLNRPVIFQAVNIVAYVVILIVNGLAGSTTVLGGVLVLKFRICTQLWLLPQGSPLLSWA